MDFQVFLGQFIYLFLSKFLIGLWFRILSAFFDTPEHLSLHLDLQSSLGVVDLNLLVSFQVLFKAENPERVPNRMFDSLPFIDWFEVKGQGV